MTQMFCHSCGLSFILEAADESEDGVCPECGDDFLEVLPNEDSHNQPDAPPSGPAQGPRQTHHRDPGGFQGHPQVINLGSVMPADIRNILEHIMGVVHDSNPHFLDEISSRLMEEYQPASHPTAAHIRESLPNLVVRKADAEGEPKVDEAFAREGDPCTICHDDFVAGSKVAELPCTHCFHSDCLFPWLETHNTCPVCRIELPEENK